MPTLLASDEHPLYYHELGTGPAVVLVHGFAAHGGYFDALAQALAADHRVIIPDLRGHRHSHQPGDRPTMERLAQDLDELLAARAADEPVCLLGWSMGALVCLDRLRQRGGADIAGLIVEDMSPRILNEGDWQLGLKGGFDAAMSSRSMALMRRDWRRFAHAAAENLFADWESTPAPLRQWALQQLKANDSEALAHLWRSLGECRFETFIASLQLPVLVVHGVRSRLYSPAVAAYWLDHLPYGQVAPCATSGHAPHLEQPEHFDRVVRDFLAGVAG